MNNYNFDKTIDRVNTYSTQWDYTSDRFGTDNVLPFSISDTDFKAPEEVVTRVAEVAKFGVYGYTRWNHDDFKDAIKDYYKRRHNTEIDNNVIVYSPSVMYVIAVLIRKLSGLNDNVVTFSPMYDAFYKVIQENDRILSASNLIYDSENYTYSIDWEDLDRRLQTAKIFILCSPHNPTGRVWTQNELSKMIDLCKKYNVWILSDEIHSDIVHTNYAHIPIINSMFNYDKIVLISSASKTFNTPGLVGSYAIFNDQETADLFIQQSRYCDFLNSASLLGIHALMVAYEQCDYYIEGLKDYVYNNYLYFKREMETISDGKIVFGELESTYLVWFNIGELELEPDKIQEVFINKGHIGIMKGDNYGDKNFMRINIGCPRSKLKEAVKRLRIAFQYIN